MFRDIAIDIGSSAIKTLVIGKKSGKYAIQHYAEEPVVIAQSQKKENVVKDAVIATLGGIKLKSSPLRLGISYGDSIVRELTLDELGNTDAEIESDIANAMSDLLPFPIEQVYFDFVREDEKTFLVASCRRELIDEKMNFLSEMVSKKKNQSFIDIDAYAYGRLISQIYRENLTTNNALLLADIGKKNTRFYVYSSNGLCFTRVQQVGGEYVTEMLIDYLNEDREQAEQLKVLGHFSSDLINDIVIPFAQYFSEQIDLMNDFYEASKKTDAKISKVVLCGGGACLDSIGDHIIKFSNFPTEIINFSKIIHVTGISGESGLLEFMAKYAQSFALSCEGENK